MRLIYNCLVLILSAIILAACGPSKPKGKEPFIGGSGEVMVVCQKSFWESEYAKDTLMPMLTQYVPAAMPAQSQLDISQIEPQFFKTGSPSKFRNVIYLDLGNEKKHQEANISIKTSVYARDQIIIYVRATTYAELKEILNQGCPEILKKINDKETERKQGAIRLHAKETEQLNIKEKKGYEICVPRKYSVLLDTGNVLWMSKITSRKKKEYDDQRYSDVVVTTYPYTSKEDFDLENIISKRDAVLKKLTWNEEKKTYRRFQEKCEPTVRVLESGENYAVEVRSMWTTEGKFQGGPSVQYVLLDYENGRIIHADGRIYAPNANKREMLRELEAIIKSIKPVHD